MERKLGVSVFSSLFMWGGISLVENDFEWESERKNHQKTGFPLPTVTYLAENLSSLKIFCFLSFIDRELLFSSDLYRESFFSFLFHCSFLCFHFFLFFLFLFFAFFLFISPSPFLPLGNRVLAFYLLSLEEIPLSSVSGERMRILFVGQGSKSLRLCFNGVFYRGNPILISGAKQIWV